MSKEKPLTDAEHAATFPPNTPHSVIDALKNPEANPDVADPRGGEHKVLVFGGEKGFEEVDLNAKKSK